MISKTHTEPIKVKEPIRIRRPFAQRAEIRHRIMAHIHACCANNLYSDYTETDLMEELAEYGFTAAEREEWLRAAALMGLLQCHEQGTEGRERICVWVHQKAPTPPAELISSPIAESVGGVSIE